MTDSRDTLFANPAADRGLFTFDEDVARVFPDMIKRSVPGYPTIISMTGLLAGKYAIAGSNLYDLGCSLGASTLAMRHAIRQPGCRIMAVDNSPDMLQRCRTIVETDAHETPVELHCTNLRTTAALVQDATSWYTRTRRWEVSVARNAMLGSLGMDNLVTATNANKS